MIKGAQKQMIVVRTGDSRYFDEAYFVLRREVKTRRHACGEMLSEADRILRESGLEPPRRRRIPRGVWLFLLGSLAGAGLAVLLFLTVL